jgi:ceramide glucosyltransferase
MIYLLLLLCLAAICYYAYGIYAAIAFLRPSPVLETDSSFAPPVTILKPLCGLDDNAEENFISFCRQDYPEYQIIFTVREADDPCIPIVKKIIADFPQLDIELVICDRTIGTNLKVSNLANGLTKAKYPILVLADSDVSVQPHYLKELVKPLQNPQVGVVTCLYRPLTQGIIANLEGLGIATEYLASVLVANQLEGMKFALGPTIAIRTEILNSFGGFPAIADYLADDFQLGYLPAQAGYEVVLSHYIIDHAIASPTWNDLIQRQVRWYLCTKCSRFWGYIGLIFTQGTALSLLFYLIESSRLGLAVLVVTWTLRLIMAWVVGVKLLKDTSVSKFLWLVPVRDLISFALWCYCLVNNTMRWRGRKLKLIENGKLQEA